MLVPSKFEKCILCVHRSPDLKSKEHLIPECIGGTLEAVILCRPCNSGFGSRFVSQLKKDPSIRMAIQHLKGRIPEFASRFEEGMDFYAKGADGICIQASRKGKSRKARAKKTKLNGLIMDTGNVPEYIRNTLKKRGFSEPEANSWVRQFAHCENGREVRLPTGDTLVKNEATVQLPKLTEGFLDHRVPVLIAFEFLALSIGSPVLGAAFDVVRQYICSGVKTERIEVLEKTSRNYDAAHTIRFQIKRDVLIVLVQFFRWYVFEIRFHHIPMPATEIIYVEDLENKQRRIALSPEQARQGKWIIL